MSECTTIIALAERLRGHSRVAWRRGRGEFAGDLRLAEHYLRRHAARLIAEEAVGEGDPARREQLVVEARTTRQGSRHHV
jgi:hypothetical protein